MAVREPTPDFRLRWPIPENATHSSNSCHQIRLPNYPVLNFHFIFLANKYLLNFKLYGCKIPLIISYVPFIYRAEMCVSIFTIVYVYIFTHIENSILLKLVNYRIIFIMKRKLLTLRVERFNFACRILLSVVRDGEDREACS